MTELLRRIGGFIRELKRRKVYRVAATYLVVAFIGLQAANLLVPQTNLPDYADQLLVYLAVFGFPLALVLAWAFDVTPEGVRRTTAVEPASTGSGPASDETASEPGEIGLEDLLRRIEDAPEGSSERSGAVAGQVLAEERLEEVEPERVRHASLAHLRHDLRTPIGVIVGYVEMLLEDAEEAGRDEDLDTLEKLEAASRRLQETVEDALDPRSGTLDAEDEEAAAFAERFRYRLRDDLSAVIGYCELVLERYREAGEDELVPDLERVLDASRQLLDRSDEIVELFAPDGEEAGEGERLERVSEIARETLARIRHLGASDDGEVRVGSILVVDDNAMNRSLMARQLARQGYTVAVAEDGVEAFELMEVRDFDLVLLDILMPRMDGIEVLRRIRARPELRDLPVIMTSSLDEADSAVRCLEAGADDYISRPVEPALLRARVASRLQARQMRERQRTQRDRLSAHSELLDRLLVNRLPAAVAERLMAGDAEVAVSVDEASVLAVQLLGLDVGSSRRPAADFVRTVTRFLDVSRRIGARHQVEAFFPRGDGFLATAGIPTPLEDHAVAAAEMALDLAEEIGPLAEDVGLPLQLRAGIHSGQAVAGMVGGEALYYDLWGAAAVVARELAWEGEAGSIHVSSATYAHLGDGYGLQRQGVVDVTGRAQMQIYRLEGRGAEG